MSERKQILIMTADAGFGHRSAANALASAFDDAYHDRCTVEVVNPFDDPTAPAILRDAQVSYDDIVRQIPDFYKLNYTISDSPLPAAVMDGALAIPLLPAIRSLVKKYCPSLVISTYPFYMSPLSAYISLRKSDLPFVTVATDLTNVHRLWFDQGTDLLALPTQEAYEQGLAMGFPADRMQVTGIPVNPAFANETRSKDEIRAELGWAPGITTALVMGSKRVKGLMDVLHLLNHSGLPLQFVLVAGGDDELFEHLKKTEWHAAVHIYNYVKTIPLFMRAADLVIGKAGGLAVTESLATGRAMLIVDVTPGQEEGNASYVVDHGAGDLADSPTLALETLYHWLDRDHKLINETAKLSAELGRPRSAYTIADLAFQISERCRVPVKPGLQQRWAQLKDLLKTFDI